MAAAPALPHRCRGLLLASSFATASSSSAPQSGARFPLRFPPQPLHRSVLSVASSSSNARVPGFENGIKGMFDLEVGIFEDPSPAPTMLEVGSRNDNCVAESSGLIPEEWKPVQEGLSRTKKQRRRDALDRLEREAKERQKRNRMLLDNQVVGRKVHMEKSFTRVLPENTTNEGPANDNDSLSRDLLSNEASVSTLVNQSTSKNPRSVLGNAPAEAMAQTSSSSRLEQQSPVGISTKTVNAKIMSKWNPMHTLAASGQKNRLDLLLRRGGEINAQDVDGFTAMHWAVLRGGARDTIIRYLLNSDAHLTAKEKDGATVLHYAARNANSFAIKSLLRSNADINACDNEGWTPLHIAAQSGRTDIVHLLFAMGADTDVYNKDGNTPLDLAQSFCESFITLAKKEMASRLIATKGSSKLTTGEEWDQSKSSTVDLSKITSKKWIPLHTLAGSGQIKHVVLLLKHSIDVDTRDKDGLTALHWAAICGRDTMVRYLLKSGADATAIDKDGASVLHYAIRCANTYAMKAVLRRHADVNACDNEGWTPLHIAVQSGRLDIIKFLLTRGADTRIKNKDGNSALDVALSFGKGLYYYHIVELLKKETQQLRQFSLLPCQSESHGAEVEAVLRDEMNSAHELRRLPPSQSRSILTVAAHGSRIPMKSNIRRMSTKVSQHQPLEFKKSGEQIIRLAGVGYFVLHGGRQPNNTASEQHP
nr:ankyrin repeat domain-containing protein, chloroplastic-like isoform X3 [Physcomitrium patens]|eukprot:XP_024358544.1 ankyrin repeat domain-containing protein, chloroplastic-like isoform X3 [Physcomitrella patens]